MEQSPDLHNGSARASRVIDGLLMVAIGVSGVSGVAAVLGVAAMPLLLAARYWQAPEVPRIVMLPVGLMLLAVAQYFMGKIPYFGQMLLYTLYLN